MNLSAVDLNVLVALDAVLSERNVTRAAARIGRSQPATSHALNRARELFKDPLLVRVRGSLELTARARLVAPRIHRLLRELGAVLDVHKDFDPAAVESVTVGATDYVGFVLLPHICRLLQGVAPRLSLRVRTVEGPDALDPVVGGAIDVALGSFPGLCPSVPGGPEHRGDDESRPDDGASDRRAVRTRARPRDLPRPDGPEAFHRANGLAPANGRRQRRSVAAIAGAAGRIPAPRIGKERGPISAAACAAVEGAQWVARASNFMEDPRTSLPIASPLVSS